MNAPGAALILLLALISQPPAVVRVSVADLEKRPELVGRDLMVEARSPKFIYDRARDWDTFTVQKSEVRFRLPPQFAFAKPPTTGGIRVRGTLRNVQGHLVFDVADRPELIPGDMERLEQAIGKFVPEDIASRHSWAEWAMRRAAEYDDDALRARAQQLAGDAIDLEAAQPANAGPFRQIELAARARELQVPEPTPTALVHRGARERLPRIASPEDAEGLVQLLEKILPQAASDPSTQNADPALLATYDRDPAQAYRAADPATRARLDRRLMADARQKAIELRANAAPSQLLALADRADKELPDRPQLARSLRLRGLETTDVRELRLAEVQDRARLFETLGEPGRARDLLRSWLDFQRTSRLTPGDAEGRLSLATQYETLASDPRSAESLLREAWAIDPNAPETARAFRERGFRLVGKDWIAPESPAAGINTNPDATASRPAASAGTDPYRGLNREQVIAMIGQPDSVSRLVTQGHLREQWLYRRNRLYLNFVQRPGTSVAVVASSVQASRLDP
jgi:hypothetical protein